MRYAVRTALSECRRTRMCNPPISSRMPDLLGVFAPLGVIDEEAQYNIRVWSLVAVRWDEVLGEALSRGRHLPHVFGPWRPFVLHGWIRRAPRRHRPVFP